LHRPRVSSPARKCPAIVYVHGGPGGQTRVEFSPLTQYLVSQGYAVFSVNNRGSSGYGKSFYMADDRKHGREPLWDIIEARRWLARQPWVDPQRTAVVGASYGGYMVLASMAFHPGEFAAAVDLFGVSNVLRALLLVPPWLAEYRDGLYEEVGNPWDPRQWPHFWDISPLYRARNIRKPLMVVQGANDARVPVAESEDIVKAVRRNGVPVEYLLLPDEGHGFSKRADEVLVFRRMKEFLDREMPAR
jgi:dipeptidyl aminopeptidase/acylaminoacyl peptidase